MSDNLPTRLATFDQEEDSVLKFKLLVPKNKYLVRTESGGDYGVDLILELKNNQSMTNFRIHMQLKSNSTRKVSNGGTFGFSVPVSTLNYLMNQPRSIFVVYVEKSNCFLWEWVAEINKVCIDKGMELSSTTQKEVKYEFQKELAYKSFDEIFNMVTNHGTFTREVSLRLMNGFEVVPGVGGQIVDTIDTFRKEYEQAQELEKGYKFAKALEKYDALSKFLKTEGIYAKCAILAESINDYKRAISYCDKILNNNTCHFEANIIKGTSLGQLRKYREAITVLEKALSLEENFIVLNNLGYSWWMNNHPEKATKYYLRILQVDQSKAVQTHINLALCYDQMFNFSEAFRHIAIALEIDPSSSKALAIAGKFHRFFGRNDIAEEYFRRSLDINPHDYVAISGLALILVERRESFEAAHYFGIWMKDHGQTLFKNKRKKEQNVLIVDMTWRSINPILLKQLTKRKFMVSFENGEEHHIEIQKKDWVAIGAILEKTEDVEIPILPYLLKVYEQEQDAVQTIKQILQRVSLTQYAFMPDTYVDVNSSIQVIIKELEKSVFFTIVFNDFRITGSTNASDKVGFKQFIKSFSSSKEIQIHIRDESKRKNIIISGVKKVFIS
ncbi:DUF4365 domain-containing protein [Paenibacillus aquistagni]|uniref:Tetratricopeptide repeat-containing protein n=1 Tax=Paenibacillus aquistagni TaxID=1852522 RepID=A0A1X7KJL9_9BACL|nr:DUF4365 domain-containing protein [Paenibacillus aquistagni]SMG41640.1 Tetratricopeptide repeat-containing protein [Paenibacillus aquistagni]